MRPRDNPFSAQRIDRLPWRPAAGQPGVDALLERLAKLGGSAAVVGPKGRGKSTLLAAVARLLEDRGLSVRRLRASPHDIPERSALRSFLAAVGEADALLLDGYDHLGVWWRHRVRRAGRRAAVLLVAAHRPGPLPVLLEARSTPELLAELVDELLEGRPPPVPQPPADELFRRHDGNLRLALRELYDRCAAAP